MPQKPHLAAGSAPSARCRSSGDLGRGLPLIGAVPTFIGFGLVDLFLPARAHSALGDELLDELGILFGPD